MVTTAPSSLLTSEPLCKATLPLPPGINQSYQVVSGSRKLAHTVRAKQFKVDAALCMSQAQVDWNVITAIKASKYKTPLVLSIKFFLPSLWQRDVDGGIKIAQDSVFNYLSLNDNLVVHLDVDKYVDKENPRCEIELRCKLGER